MSDTPSFGTLLRQFRLAAGLTQEVLAERTQLSVIAISALERGVRQAPYAETVRRLTAALTLEPQQQAALKLAARRPRGATTGGGPVAPPRSQLSPPLTSFVGREREQRALRHLLTDGRRLVTLTGPGGVGKTRLALEVVRVAAGDFSDGVWIGDLAPLTDAALVSQSVATLLGVRPTPADSLLNAIVAALGDRAALLVLDNCEHLVDACAGLVAALLRDCIGLTVLVTSREPLHLPGEQLYPLSPLPVPHDGAAPAERSGSLVPAAVRLFIDRAQAVRPEFAPAPAALAIIGSICRELDGLPLAIEMVAAQTRVLSVKQIQERLASRLETVVGSDRGVTVRHGTLRALLEWSFSRLHSPEQTLIRRLSVFSGGCELEAVEAVCADAEFSHTTLLATLTALADKSMLVVDAQPEAARYRLLESIRAYAAEQLAASDEARAVQARHATYYVQLARTGRRALTGPQQATWVQRLEREHHNLRAALAASLAAEEGETALRLCAALSMFWYIRGYYSEGRDWIARALSVAEGAAARSRAAALHGAASLAAIQHDHAEALRLSRESVALWRTVGDARGLAASLAEFGMHARHTGDLDAARQACEEALALYATAPDPWGQRLALGVLGWVAEMVGDRAAAWRWLEASLVAARAAASPVDVALQLNNLGILALRSGDTGAAEARYNEALQLAREVDALEPMACSLEGLGGVVAARSAYRRAAWLVGVAAGMRESIGAPRVAQFEEEYQRLLPRLRAALGEDGLAEAMAEGAAAEPDEVIAAVHSGVWPDERPRPYPVPLRRA